MVKPSGLVWDVPGWGKPPLSCFGRDVLLFGQEESFSRHCWASLGDSLDNPGDGVGRLLPNMSPRWEIIEYSLSCACLMSVGFLVIPHKNTLAPADTH